MVHSKSTKSDVFSYKCTCPTFVLVRRLYQSDVCTSPTFVSFRFVPSDVCGSDVCTSTSTTGGWLKTSAYARDLQRRPPYPARGGGAIYLDLNSLMNQAASLASAEEVHLESDYLSLTNAVYSTTDIVRH